LLRREGLYSSHLTDWRRQREGGELVGLAAKKRGPKARKNPLADEVTRLQRENERMKAELAKANTVIDVQRKVAALLGEALPEPTEEEIELGRGRFRTGRLDIKNGRRS
jgi:transposase